MSKTTKAIEYEGYRDSNEVKVYDVQHPDAQARLAIELAKVFSFVAGKPDGEDSAGRAKLALLTPEEVAGRACRLSEELWSQFKHRGWILDLPELKPPTPLEKGN